MPHTIKRSENEEWSSFWTNHFISITGGWFEDAVEADVAEHVANGIEDVEALQRSAANIEYGEADRVIDDLEMQEQDDGARIANEAVFDAYAFDASGGYE